MLISQTVSLSLDIEMMQLQACLHLQTQLNKRAVETLALWDCVITTFLTTLQTMQLIAF